MLCLLGACTVGEAGPNGPAPDALPGDDAPAGGTPSTLRISATTTTTAGDQYAPRNCTAVWIESGGTFIKTIDRKADVRRQHLVAWTAKAGGGDTDAVSGATRASHATPLSITWDLKDGGTIVPDGSYTIRMESTELNAVDATENHQGTFTFVKGAQADEQTGQSSGGFTNVSITFTP